MKKSVTAAISTLGKMYGSPVISVGVPVESPSSTSTGISALDEATGIGGYPKGRVIEIFGPESSGKTTLTLHAIAAAQRAGGVCAFIDAEHALNAVYANACGVDVARLLVAQPAYGEQALETVDQLARSEGVDLVVVDSVAALVPRSETEGQMGDASEGLQDRLMDQALRKITPVIGEHGTTLIFTNQLRMKSGIVFGNPETTCANSALKFYASMRLDIRKIGAVKDGEQVVGSRVRVKVVKNKCAAPFHEAEFAVCGGVTA